MVFNPLDQPVQKRLKVPLYYAGLGKRASVAEQEGRGRSYPLARDSSIDLPVQLAPQSVTWFVVR